MNNEFSEDLREAIVEGFVLLDEPNRRAFVGANVTALPAAAEDVLLLLRKRLGLSAELSMRHGYTVL
jgi:hypothetical protein